MTRLAITHAASDAQHRDRAAFIIIFPLAHVNLVELRDIFFFCVTQTPAHWEAENWRAKGRCAYGSGGGSSGSSPVPLTGTGKALKRCHNCVSSTGSTQFASRDVCACMRRCARVMRYLFSTGTGGTRKKEKADQCFSGSIFSSSALYAVEPWNRALPSASQVTDRPSKSHLIRGGYAASATIMADLRYCGAAAPRNFSGRRGGRLGRIGSDPRSVASRAANGGNPPLPVARSVHVGTAMSEQMAETADLCGVHGAQPKPARLAGHADPIAQESPRGVELLGRGVEPPFGARLVSRMLARPIFSKSIDLLDYCSLIGVMGRNGHSISNAEIGSGSGLYPVSAARRREAHIPGGQYRVWDQLGAYAASGLRRGSSTLWGGVHHVNG